MGARLVDSYWHAGRVGSCVSLLSHQFCLSLQNTIRESVRVSSALWLGLAICLRSAEPGLQDEFRNSAARFRYGCTTGDGLLFL